MASLAHHLDRLNALNVSISTERLSTYLTRANGDPIQAIRLYEWNTELSETLYSVLQGLEIAVRNSIHSTLSDAYGQSNWYDAIHLEPQEQSRIRDAKRKIRHAAKPMTAGRMISELTFGFWVALLTKQYAVQLWIPHLHRAFPHKRLAHGAAHRRLNAIRYLRNRVAHHECILSRNLENDYLEIIEAVGWICPETANWICETTRFEQATEGAIMEPRNTFFIPRIAKSIE